MFDIAPSELLLVAIVALVVIGPKDLPKALRVAGYWVGKARGVARQFRSGFDSMVREAELEEMEKRWASENERIMREHPQSSPAQSSPADDVEATTVTADPAADHGTAIEPTQAAHSGSDTSARDHATSTHNAPAIVDPAIVDPVIVEKPQVVARDTPTAHHVDPAAS